MLIGDRIKKLRIQRGLKQVDLARALGVSPQAVSKWERDDSLPDIAMLADLATLLNVTTDFLLGVTEQPPGEFEGTVFCSSLNQFARQSTTMQARQVADWANRIFYPLTESVLRYDGVPVKYVGDGFLCFFSGQAHSERAVQAAVYARTLIDYPNLVISLNAGPIYLGSIGHPDYARTDICGATVNLAFLIMDWIAHNCPSGIGFTETVADRLPKDAALRKHPRVSVETLSTHVAVYELKTLLARKS
jgi:class 3 adenylate cyclase